LTPLPGRIVVCGVGLKGSTFAETLLRRGIRIDQIVTYDNGEDRTGGFDRLRLLAAQSSIALVETRHPEPDAKDLTFLIGWQHLLPSGIPSTVVFHDSLLPRYRGFAPTVTALIRGDREIGVTALAATDGIDEGPIIAQASVRIDYPIKIEAALKLQAGLMADLAVDIVARWRSGSLAPTPQEPSGATFSIWRDDADYEIDWSRSATEIERFVDAVGHPYPGARTTVAGVEIIRVHDVAALSDLPFEIRHVGKIWRLDQGRPLVVCGSGLLQINRSTREHGSEYRFQRLRVRLGAVRT
jgi:methionyl-tRNA formyltransferase